MKTKYHKLLQNLEPFIISHPSSFQNFDLNYIGTEIKPENCINPLLISSQKFIEKIYRLDELSFGGVGMGMPKWVFFDCAVIPGIVVGFGIKAKGISLRDKDNLCYKAATTKKTSKCIFKCMWLSYKVARVS